MRISIILLTLLLTQSGLAQSHHAESKIAICQIHKCKLYKSLVPVFNGLRYSGYSKTYYDAEKTIFPHHHIYSVNYGCDAGYSAPAEMYFCAECDLARKQWLRAHPSEWHIGMDEENADLEKEELEKIASKQSQTIPQKLH